MNISGSYIKLGPILTLELGSLCNYYSINVWKIFISHQNLSVNVRSQQSDPRLSPKSQYCSKWDFNTCKMASAQGSDIIFIKNGTILPLNLVIVTCPTDVSNILKFPFRPNAVRNNWPNSCKCSVFINFWIVYDLLLWFSVIFDLQNN